MVLVLISLALSECVNEDKTCEIAQFKYSFLRKYKLAEKVQSEVVS